MIYARFSSHNQREASIEQQIEWCVDLAKRYNLTVLDTYADKAISGRTDNRPSFQRMMADAKTGKFDVVLAWKSNRMGRNMLEAMLNDSVLLEEGVRTIYVEEDFEDNAAGRFALRNMMNVNQFYSEALAEDVKRGMMDNAKKCMVNGRTPYGYRKGNDGKYEIVQDQAEIVREIFNRVIEGWPYVDIMSDLNARGIRNRDGNIWQRTTFDKMLRNEQYIGVYKFSGVRTEGGIPPILNREIFEEVQTILTTKKHPRGRRRNTQDYMLTGKLFCGICGNPMVGICGTSRNGERHYYYLCQGKHNKTGCTKQNEKQEKIEQAVVNYIKKLIMDDETIDWLLAGLQEFEATLRAQSTITAMESELAETEKAIGNLMKAIEMGIITDTTKDRMMELEEQKRDLQQRIRIENKMLVELDPEDLRFVLVKYRDTNLNDRQYQRELINTLIKAVYVYDDHLTIVGNRGTNDTVEVKFDDISSIGVVGVSDVRTNATKPHQVNTVRTAVMFREYGIVAVVPYN